MNDFVYIPKVVARLLLDEAVSWELAESVSSLLTIPVLKDFVEKVDRFSRYIVNLSDLGERVNTKENLSRFTFKILTTDVPYLANIIISPGKQKKISFWVHDLCNPVNFGRRHLFDHEAKSFPPDIWKIPRHTLIRWRYSSRLPIHKSNFARPRSTDFKFKDSLVRWEPIRLFTEVSRLFYAMTRECDESSLAYCFVCHLFYWCHDRLIKDLRDSRNDPGLRAFLALFLEILQMECSTSNHPTKKLEAVEARIRPVLPFDFFTKHPFSLFSSQSLTKSERFSL